MILVRWIRIQIGNANTHLDQGGKNNPKNPKMLDSGPYLYQCGSTTLERIKIFCGSRNQNINIYKNVWSMKCSGSSKLTGVEKRVRTQKEALPWWSPPHKRDPLRWGRDGGPARLAGYSPRSLFFKEWSEMSAANLFFLQNFCRVLKKETTLNNFAFCDTRQYEDVGLQRHIRQEKRKIYPQLEKLTRQFSSILLSIRDQDSAARFWIVLFFVLKETQWVGINLKLIMCTNPTEKYNHKHH